MAFPRVTQILFFLCIIINSNRVHSTASTELSGEDEEQFLNATTRIIKQTRRVRRNLAFQPGSRIMVREKRSFFFDDIKRILKISFEWTPRTTSLKSIKFLRMDSVFVLTLTSLSQISHHSYHRNKSCIIIASGEV